MSHLSDLSVSVLIFLFRLESPMNSLMFRSKSKLHIGLPTYRVFFFLKLALLL